MMQVVVAAVWEVMDVLPGEEVEWVRFSLAELYPLPASEYASAEAVKASKAVVLLALKC